MEESVSWTVTFTCNPCAEGIFLENRMNIELRNISVVHRALQCDKYEFVKDEKWLTA